MKRYSVLAGTILLILGAAANVSALSLEFTDVVSRGFRQPLVFSEDSPSVTYRHSILDQGFRPAVHELTGGSLDINFWGVEVDDASVSLSLDTSSAREIDGIRHWSILFWLEDYNLDLGADIRYLQDDGHLDVTLTRNPGGEAGILGLHSLLTAYAEGPAPVPTPEPASIILFGIGLVGFAAYRKKSKSK